MYFTKNLTWTKHLEESRKKVLRKINSARSLLGSTRGLPIKASRWIYSAIIVPIMTYGAIAWAARDFSDKDKKLLRKTNRIAANIMITPKKSTPSSKLEIILDIKPLDIKAQERALSTWARLGGETLKLDWDGEMKQKKESHWDTGSGWMMNCRKW